MALGACAGMTAVFAIGPALGVAMGGFLTSRFGWVSYFYFLIVYSLFLLVSSAFLSETTKKVEKDALDLKVIKKKGI
jgi:MFS family permease